MIIVKSRSTAIYNAVRGYEMEMPTCRERSGILAGVWLREMDPAGFEPAASSCSGSINVSILRRKRSSELIYGPIITLERLFSWSSR